MSIQEYERFLAKITRESARIESRIHGADRQKLKRAEERLRVLIKMVEEKPVLAI